jgi:hypothetical protein
VLPRAMPLRARPSRRPSSNAAIAWRMSGRLLFMHNQLDEPLRQLFYHVMRIFSFVLAVVVVIALAVMASRYLARSPGPASRNGPRKIGASQDAGERHSRESRGLDGNQQSPSSAGRHYPAEPSRPWPLPDTLPSTPDINAALARMNVSYA